MAQSATMNAAAKRKPGDLSKALRFGEIVGPLIGSPMAPVSRIFDLGSGAGTLLQDARELGYDGYGADFFDDGSPALEIPYLKKIEKEGPYRIPYPDEHFDFGFSTGVFEHVKDYDSTMAELQRILKPGAWSLNLFPPRYAPI